MTGEFKYARNLLARRLEIYRQLQGILENVMANKQNSQWGVDQLAAVKDRFSILVKMDVEEAKIQINKNEFVKDEAVIALISELKRIMLNVKRLLSMIQIRLEGGKQMISFKLRKISEGKRIKGYKNNRILFSETHTRFC